MAKPKRNKYEPVAAATGAIVLEVVKVYIPNSLTDDATLDLLQRTSPNDQEIVQTLINRGLKGIGRAATARGGKQKAKLDRKKLIINTVRKHWHNSITQARRNAANELKSLGRGYSYAAIMAATKGLKKIVVAF